MPTRHPATRHPRRRRRDERGDAIVIFCVGMILIILPLGGVSLDLWHSVSDERALQSAADAATAAGAGAIDTAAYRLPGGDTQPLLDPAAAANQALASLQTQTDLPALSQPPEIDATPQGITVRLHEQVQLTLLRIVAGNRTINLTATASSGPRPSGAP